MNFIAGEIAEVTDSGVVVELTGGGTVTAGARPEHIRITTAGDAPLAPRSGP